MSKVLINTNFYDAHTGELYIAGEFTDLTEERIAEVKLVDPNFITVVKAESNTGSASTTPVDASSVPRSLSDMTKKELIEIGKEQGLELNDSMTKKVMIEAIEKASDSITTEDDLTSTPVDAPAENKPSADELIDELDGTIEDIEE